MTIAVIQSASQVFVVSPDKQFDLSAARRFGDVQFINNRYVYGDEIDPKGQLPTAFVVNMSELVAQFNPDRDYLLIVGDQLQLIAFAAMLAVEHGHFRVLRWDRNEKAYFPVMVST